MQANEFNKGDQVRILNSPYPSVKNGTIGEVTKVEEDVDVVLVRTNSQYGTPTLAYYPREIARADEVFAIGDKVQALEEVEYGQDEKAIVKGAVGEVRISNSAGVGVDFTDDRGERVYVPFWHYGNSSQCSSLIEKIETPTEQPLADWERALLDYPKARPMSQQEGAEFYEVGARVRTADNAWNRPGEVGRIETVEEEDPSVPYRVEFLDDEFPWCWYGHDSLILVEDEADETPEPEPKRNLTAADLVEGRAYRAKQTIFPLAGEGSRDAQLRGEVVVYRGPSEIWHWFEAASDHKQFLLSPSEVEEVEDELNAETEETPEPEPEVEVEVGVGDFVKIIADPESLGVLGEVGKVIEIEDDPDDEIPVSVLFEDGADWWFAKSGLEVVPSVEEEDEPEDEPEEEELAFQPGQVVRVNVPGHPTDGHEGKVRENTDIYFEKYRYRIEGQPWCIYSADELVAVVEPETADESPVEGNLLTEARVKEMLLENLQHTGDQFGFPQFLIDSVISAGAEEVDDFFSELKANVYNEGFEAGVASVK